MSEILVGSDGVRVERILGQRRLDRQAREMLRVRLGTYLVADCATVAEVAQLVDVAMLVPEQRADRAIALYQHDSASLLRFGAGGQERCSLRGVGEEVLAEVVVDGVVRAANDQTGEALDDFIVLGVDGAHGVN